MAAASSGALKPGPGATCAMPRAPAVAGNPGVAQACLHETMADGTQPSLGAARLIAGV
jgi:hypothetical protein